VREFHRSAQRIRRDWQRDTQILELDAPKFARYTVDPDQPPNLRSLVAVSGRKRQSQLCASRVAMYGRKHDAMSTRESVRQQDILVGSIEICRSIIVPPEVTIPLEHGGAGRYERTLARHSPSRRISAFRRAIQPDPCLKGYCSRRDEALRSS
jgi:hypothetical protein